MSIQAQIGEVAILFAIIWVVAYILVRTGTLDKAIEQQKQYYSKKKKFIQKG